MLSSVSRKRHTSNSQPQILHTSLGAAATPCNEQTTMLSYKLHTAALEACLTIACASESEWGNGGCRAARFCNGAAHGGQVVGPTSIIPGLLQAWGCEPTPDGLGPATFIQVTTLTQVTALIQVSAGGSSRVSLMLWATL